MATTTEDPRIQKIEETKTYVLLYDKTEPLYVGSTARPLSRRLSEHKKEAERRDTKLYNRLEELDLDEVTIHPIPLLSEKEALEHLGGVTLNAHSKPEATYEGPSWTSDMVDVLEDANSSTEAAAQLGISYHYAHDARKKLGVGEDRDYRRLSEREVVEIYVRYHATDVTQAELAEQHGVSEHAIGQVTRRESHEDVWVPSKVAIEAKRAYQDDIVREEPAVGTKRMGHGDD